MPRVGVSEDARLESKLRAHHLEGDLAVVIELELDHEINDQTISPLSASASLLMNGRNGVVSFVMSRTYVVQLRIHKGRVWRHEVLE